MSDIALHTGSVATHVTGGYRLTPQATVLDLHLASPNLPVDQVEQLLPAVGVELAQRLFSQGRNTHRRPSITGPANSRHHLGSVSIENTQLAGFDLGSKIEGINPFGSKGGGTAIQTLRTDVNSSPQTTQFNNILANLPQIGTATGKGTVSPSSALDFALSAKFTPTPASAPSRARLRPQSAASWAASPLSNRAKSPPSDGGIPLTITGTASDPHIRANLKAMLK